jgi:FkbM family methyltransferase
MTPPLADVARRVRHAPVLRRQEWLWARLRPLYRRLQYRRSRRHGVVRTVNGQLFRLRYPFSEIAGDYESVVFRAFTDLLRPGMTVFDVGANVGIYAIAAARGVAPHGRVVAFEPARSAAEVMVDHLRLNGVQDAVEVVEAVVDERSGTTEFWEQGATAASSVVEAAARIGERFSGEAAVLFERASVSIDDFCRQRGAFPDVLKIDVEGAEGRVVRGAREFLARRSGSLLVEVHSWALEQLGETRDDVLAPLANAGWSCELIADDGNTLHYLCKP